MSETKETIEIKGKRMCGIALERALQPPNIPGMEREAKARKLAAAAKSLRSKAALLIIRAKKKDQEAKQMKAELYVDKLIATLQSKAGRATYKGVDPYGVHLFEAKSLEGQYLASKKDELEEIGGVCVLTTHLSVRSTFERYGNSPWEESDCDSKEACNTLTEDEKDEEDPLGIYSEDMFSASMAKYKHGLLYRGMEASSQVEPVFHFTIRPDTLLYPIENTWKRGAQERCHIFVPNLIGVARSETVRWITGPEPEECTCKCKCDPPKEICLTCRCLCNYDLPKVSS